VNELSSTTVRSTPSRRAPTVTIIRAGERSAVAVRGD
jgi:hypothetical protein